jgi:hypothetical protein
LSGLVGGPLSDLVITTSHGFEVGVVAISVVETKCNRVAEFIFSGHCGGKEAGSDREGNRSSHIDLCMVVLYGVLHLLIVRAET